MSTGPKPNCPWRKPPKRPLDRADKIAHVVGGAMLGALACSFFVIELVFAALISEQGTLWLPIAVGCVSTTLGGVLGGVIGTRFRDWMSDNWHEFHRYHSQFRQD